MAKLVFCSFPGLPVLWDIDGTVVSNSANRPEDVYLVQMMMADLGTNYQGIRTDDSQNFQLAASNITINGICDSDTMAALQIFQIGMSKSNPGMATDARFSPCGGKSRYGSGFYDMFALNNMYSHFTSSNWPLLDSSPFFPRALLPMMQRCLYGTP